MSATATEALANVQAAAEQIRNDETATVGTVSVGDVIRQGDLYVICITGLLAGIGRRKIKDRQLAPGTSQGSRHVLTGKCAVYRADDPAQVIAAITKALAPRKAELHPPLIGPLFETVAETELQHPEHGDRVLPAGEEFAVVYQRAFADVVRRQVD